MTNKKRTVQVTLYTDFEVESDTLDDAELLAERKVGELFDELDKTTGLDFDVEWVVQDD